MTTETLVKKQEMTSGKRLERLMVVLKVFYFLFMIGFMLAVINVIVLNHRLDDASRSIFASKDPILKQLIVWVGIGVASFIPAIICGCVSKSLDLHIGHYECKCCGQLHKPTRAQYEGSLGFLQKRYLQCPHCEQKSWHHKNFD